MNSENHGVKIKAHPAKAYFLTKRVDMAKAR
jgi:hypothetical protein